MALLLQDNGLGPQAARLLLPGEAGQPDEEDLPYLSQVFGAAIEVTQAGEDAMCLRCGEGEARLGVERCRQEDGAGHGSWHYIVRWCRRPALLQPSAEEVRSSFLPIHLDGSHLQLQIRRRLWGHKAW